ncbi:hypothetical protein HPE56_20070 [Maribacter sp. ANRC-HE7]|uniref:Uncharacterized protein n=1 Tax=Maribacter aquimaris TaxID=2737171 RepID=A0ABR7V5M6_9FLAO|nr:hypothetical protein [Maribacter aquimaris]MBD0780102.1 hypothetical protein [Maribacter aquimaris]
MNIEDFFYKSTYLDMFVLKPLWIARGNWDLSWDSETKRYIVEEDSFGQEINDLISEIENTKPPKKYHDNEDILAEYVNQNLNWDIKKIKNRWEGAEYKSILEQGGFGDIDEKNLVSAATARIHTAIKFGQKHFDEMENGHMIILSNILSIILYHRFTQN